MKKVAYINETPLPSGAFWGKNISYSQNRKKNKNINSQLLWAPISDMEALINKGLKDLDWFKRFLQNTSMSNVLDYAEQEIKKNNNLNDVHKQELLEIIEQNEVRQVKK